MDNDTVRKALPPYVSYRTFRNFIDELQMGIPARIDRSYWGERYSGSTGTQLMTALRFLGLINGGGVPTTRLRQLVSAAGAQRPEVLKQIARTAFDFLSERSLDPGVATYAQLEQAFSSTYQMTSDVTRKCIKFLINLLDDAGVSLSPYILKRSRAIRSGIGKKGPTKKAIPRTNGNSMASSDSGVVPEQTVWYEMVLAKFPNFDPTWTDEVKMKWFEAFDSLLDRDRISSNGK